MAEQSWLLWDGECGLCKRAARWVQQGDTRGVFRVVPYQEAPSPPMNPVLSSACARAVHVVKPDGTILRAGRASLFILERIGWGWFARLLRLPPFIWLVELVYWFVARNRPFFARFMFTHE